MDNRKKYALMHTNQSSAQLTSQAQQHGYLELGLYKNRGRVAKIHTDSFYLEGLQDDPQKTHSGHAAFDITNWLLDKPRLPGEQRKNYLLSTLDEDDFSGFKFHPLHNLWVYSFNSPHQWRDGEPRSQSQFVELLLPSGQSERHYGMLILAGDANDLQVELARHWLELTGGGLLIIENDTTLISKPVQLLLDELEYIQDSPASEQDTTIFAQYSQPGISVTATPAFHEDSSEQKYYVLDNLTYYFSGLPQQIEPTTWVYEGVLTVPKSERLILYVDTQYHPYNLTLDIDQYTHQINAQDECGEIVIKHTQKGQQVHFKITTTTQNNAPNIRLGWGFSGQESVQFIPDDFIHHTPLITTENTSVEQPAPHSLFNPDGYQQALSLPSTSINSFALTEETRNNSDYFSIQINSSRLNTVLRLDDISLSPHDSWEGLAAEIEDYVNQQLADLELPLISAHYKNNQIVITCGGMIVSQFQLKNQQLHPILIAENPHGIANQFHVGVLSGSLPFHEEIEYFQLIEEPLFGEVVLNEITGEWQYIPDGKQSFRGHDQFDFIAIMKDGSVSAPMSIQLQSEEAPYLSLPSKRIFTLPDPIYHQPQMRHHPVPSDMQIHSIQLAQTHLLEPHTKYFSLTADRPALLKIDITSASEATAPDIVAIIRNKEGVELEKVVLTGPSNLPAALTPPPNTPSFEAKDWHRYSYTAPIKGKWIQPDMEIQILAGGIPITQYGIQNVEAEYAMPDEGTPFPFYTAEGSFFPRVKKIKPITAHVAHKTLYQDGHGTYPHSPLSWGLEALAKLLIHQLTLYSYPPIPQKSALYPCIVQDDVIYTDRTTLVHLLYDAPSSIQEPSMSQIESSYLESQKAARRTELYSEFFYIAILPLSMEGGTSGVIGLATHNFGGGISKPSILWHEMFGHGLALGHTTNEGYPYPAESHGKNIAYDSYRQQYTTFRKDEPEYEIIPAMYPSDYPHYSDQYDAFLAHSDYYIYLAQHFLSKINESEVPGEYVSVYQLNGIFLPLPDGSQHPYSYLAVTQTLGQLIQQDHSDSSHSLTITYVTPSGLLTESLKISLRDNELNLNIPNKGELVSLKIIKTENGTDTEVYHYKNPESLANRLFIYGDGKTVPEQLQIDNYWRGSRLSWSATDKNLIDISTGKVNSQYITPQSAICASWIENGQLHQQYFSLSDPFGQNNQVDTTHHFQPIHHFDMQNNENDISTSHLNILSDIRLLSDVHINQQIDISKLGITEKNNQYWVTLLIYDEQGIIQEKTPQEPWFLSQNKNILSVKGTIDSTPGLKIAGIKIYIDQHLHDDVAARSVWLNQNTNQTLDENTEFLNYDRPVEFNSLASQMAGMKEDTISAQQQATQWVESAHFIPLVA